MALAPEVKDALARDRTVDIITTGAKTGRKRTTEIWFTRVDQRIILCGTPSAAGDGRGEWKRRNWLANLRAHPHFVFRLKESVQVELEARAVEVTDSADRRYIMSAPGTRWYREQAGSIELLIAQSPIVEVFFE